MGKTHTLFMKHLATASLALFALAACKPTEPEPVPEPVPVAETCDLKRMSLPSANR